ncbi:hypothetical protein PanWU01x14_357190 [Parasponia andersonii]|uniref:Uncharacterized protein n=1 Tax=Parasponia andersonii TaxID=3476 RepID=A0A2P5A8Q6_PARAD|nr:hypothetical protein PanWU01x14_357190 [Parasponia andersonii]
MRSGYSDNFFVELLGKSMVQFWSNYEARYDKY